MVTKTPFVYVPALRLKAGEYRALDGLAPDVANRIAPRLVMPAVGERDPEAGRALSKEEILHETGRRIGSHWRLRLAFLEPRFLFAALGEEESVEWLPRIFKVARDHHARPVPVATLDDMTGQRAPAFQRAMAKDDRVKMAVRVDYGDIDKTLDARVRQAMSSFGIVPGDCVFLLDFAEADFSNVTAAAEVMNSALARVQAVGLWQDVVFQGTNYPEKNPADVDSCAIVPRNEWLAWKLAVSVDEIASRRLIFGDYGADCAKFVFRTGGGAPAIRHYRYCTGRHWRVDRGKPDAKQLDAMRSVCARILASGEFAGRDFSAADKYIYETAKGLNGGGSAATWREMNTGHHITRVVSDLGGPFGFEIKRTTIAEPPYQPELI